MSAGEAPQYPRESDEFGYDITQQIGHFLRKAYKTHTAVFQQLSACPSVTPAQFAVLCAIDDCGPSSLTVIGKQIVMDLATVRGIVKRLAQRKLISISPAEGDRRQVIAALEPAGRRVLRAMIPSAKAISEATVQNLNPAERVALNFLLEKISAREDLDPTPED